MTSLLDEARYTTAEFQVLYHLRWGIETFYGLLKSRLELENFTGTRAESVKQDFYASMYLTGLESILTDAAQKQLDAKKNQYCQKVNRSVAFNAIKTQAFGLLLGEEIECLEEKLTALFLTNPVVVRKHRNPSRQKASSRRLLNYHKRQKKHCY